MKDILCCYVFGDFGDAVAKDGHFGGDCLHDFRDMFGVGMFGLLEVGEDSRQYLSGQLVPDIHHAGSHCGWLSALQGDRRLLVVTLSGKNVYEIGVRWC